MRSGNTYTTNGVAEMIKEIVANIKTNDLEIMFRMDIGYFDEEISEKVVISYEKRSNAENYFKEAKYD